ncbi:hypothetical protein [Paenibacillus sp. B2(2019)]|uniref:hypothetical protein n=1 Tax=Paenibacillus sp. B2(2019) TaxID=2607754 RepID=UPI0011F23186|nr:hypothetical protein [Paenibacillus sp. B2(2019)]KAA1191352.1 hypothetical protein PAENI_03805 [Paenibacillus sp. B2(2019)]
MEIRIQFAVGNVNGQMYAKNRIQCATGKLNEPNVCEKPNTMCRWQAERAKYTRKIEYNVPPTS